MPSDVVPEVSRVFAPWPELGTLVTLLPHPGWIQARCSASAPRSWFLVIETVITCLVLGGSECALGPTSSLCRIPSSTLKNVQNKRSDEMAQG